MLLCLGMYPIGPMIYALFSLASGQEHWLLLTFVSYAGMSLWPSYLIGQACFFFLLIKPHEASKSLPVAVAIAINATISWLYVVVTIVFQFVVRESSRDARRQYLSTLDGSSQSRVLPDGTVFEFTVAGPESIGVPPSLVVLAIILGSVAACQTFIALILFRQRRLEETQSRIGVQRIVAVALLLLFVFGLLSKYPLANDELRARKEKYIAYRLEWFVERDTDRDGRMNSQEASRLYRFDQSMFARDDTNHDGFLTKKEYEVGLRMRK